jgi:hypothetical protein
MAQMSRRYPESSLLRNWSAMSTNFMRSLRFAEFGPPSVFFKNTTLPRTPGRDFASAYFVVQRSRTREKRDGFSHIRACLLISRVEGTRA